MYKKRALADLSQVPPDKRLREDMVDLFLGNQVSAQRAARMFQNAQLAGAAHVKDLQVRGETNARRDLMQKVRKGCKWPSLYYIKVRGQHFRTQEPQEMTLSMLLPHEVLFCMMQVQEKEALLQTQKEQGAPDTLQDLRLREELFGVPEGNLLGLGIWMDGVPFNRPRNKSLEVVAWNIVGQGSMRIPITCLPKDFVDKHATFDDLLSVVSWSMRCLIWGTMPSSRHDGSAFQASDAWRMKKNVAGEQIGLQAALVELRGDWSMYKEIFRFPGWSGHGHICWKCNCTIATLRSARADASWRQGFTKTELPNPMHSSPIPFSY